MAYSATSKVWIYQSETPFTPSDLTYLEEKLSLFTQNWTAHNQELQAGFEIRYQQFIVLIVDETQANASGCSIDKSVHLMQEIEQDLQISLFNRLKMAYILNGEVKIADRTAFEELIAAGSIDKNTIVFNNLVKNYQEYQKDWESPMANSWHAKVFAI